LKKLCKFFIIEKNKNAMLVNKMLAEVNASNLIRCFSILIQNFNSDISINLTLVSLY